MDTYPPAGGPAGPDAAGAHGTPGGPAASPHSADGPPTGAGTAGGPPSRPADGAPAGAGFFAAVRRTGLYRGDDRWAGGVCDGLARRFGIDPLLVRGIFAASILLGGLGLVAYGVAWALLPEQSDGRIHVEEMVAGNFDVALLGALGLTIVGLARGDHWLWFWDGPPGWVQALLWISFLGGLLMLVAVATNRRSGATAPGAAPAADPWVQQTSAPVDPWVKQPRAAGTPTAPGVTVHPDQPPVAYGPYGPYRPEAAAPFAQRPVPPVPPVPPAPPKPPRSGPGAGSVGVVVALTLLGLAVLLMAERTGNFDGPVLLTTLGLGVVLSGLGIIVSGLRGRTSGVLGFLAVVGILVALPAGAVQTVDWGWRGNAHSQVGAGTYLVESRRDAADGYQLGVGDSVIDLTGVPLTQQTLDVPISFGVGDLTIIVPADAAVAADVRAGAGTVYWELDGETRQVGGVAVADTTFEDEQSSAGTPQLRLQVSLGAGEVRITEESR